jgi:3-deoxy-D-manno-octulosonate 8-phosphate phosphatase (KDO 8-P phosphatase)
MSTRGKRSVSRSGESIDGPLGASCLASVSTDLLKAVRFVAFDFDGVFTDNRVFVSQTGEESVACCRSDGLGLARLREAGVDCMIISTEENPVVSARAAKLKITCRQGVTDKLAALREEVARRSLSLEQTAFVGNDINDATCLGAVGLPVLVADAWEEVRQFARLMLERRGGEGAVREFCDRVWQAQGAGLRQRPPV